MIHSLSIEHWHHEKANFIEACFYTVDCAGVMRARFHRASGASLDRFMGMVRREVVHGRWVCRPSSVGSRYHWSYMVTRAVGRRSDAELDDRRV